MNKKNPKVSVLIPAFNAERFIQRTINSVLNQTFLDFEIIVVDDGSKDRTKDIVSAMQKQDSRINYFYRENQGLSNTRNRLVELAKGEFLAFLDHDDEWLPKKIEKQLRLFEKDSSLGLVFSDAYIKKDDKTIATCFEERRPFRGYVFYKYLFSDNFAPLLTVILPKKVLLKFLPFNPEYEINEEFDMFLKIARHYKFDYVEEPLAIYHIHGNNVIISRAQRLAEENFTILDWWLKKEPSIAEFYKKELNRRLSQLYCKKGLYFLDKKNVAGVREAIFNSFKYKLLNLEATKLSIKLLLYILKLDRKGND